MGLRRRRRQPRRSARCYHSAPLRFAMGTLLAGGRIVVPGHVRPGDASPRPSSRAPHDDVLRADPPAAALRALGRGRRARPVVASGWSPTPARPARRRSSAGSSSCSPPVRRGSSTAPPRASSPPAASEEWLERPGTVGRARPGPRLSLDDDGTIWCAVPAARPVHLPRRPRQDRRGVARDARRTGVHASATSAGSTPTATSTSTAVATTWSSPAASTSTRSRSRTSCASCPGVEDVAVFGVADPDWGQRVCAAVVGTAARGRPRAHARERLAPPKRPKT